MQQSVCQAQQTLTDMSVPVQNKASIQQLHSTAQSTAGMYCVQSVQSASWPSDTLNAKIFFLVQNLARDPSHKTVMQLWADLLYETGMM